MNVHERLVAARNVADREWTPDGRCLSNCIYDTGESWGGAHKEIVRLLGYEDPVLAGPAPIFDWNDAEGRTKAEVLALFDRAIAATAPEPMDPLHDVETQVPVAA